MTNLFRLWFGSSFVLLILGVVQPAFANEPLWTPQERTQLREAVVVAKVASVKMVRPLKENIDLMKATLQIEGISKSCEGVREAAALTVYFESSPLGAGYRCPSFAVLEKDQRAQFYLRNNASLTGEKAFFLEMGSDVSPLP